MNHISFLQLWNASKSHGIDIPIQVVTLALYVELQLGELLLDYLVAIKQDFLSIFSLQDGQKLLAISLSSIARSIDESHN
jgi:hypothetical protein